MSRSRIAFLILVGATFVLTTCAKSNDQAVELQLLDGKTAYLSDFDGQVIALYFWASWCPPCQTTMPILEELHNEYRDSGLVVLGLNQREAASKAQAYAEEVGATYPIVLDQNAEIANYFRVMGPPVTILLDRDGEVLKQFVGMVSRDQLDEILEPLYGEGGD